MASLVEGCCCSIGQSFNNLHTYIPRVETKCFIEHFLFLPSYRCCSVASGRIINTENTVELASICHVSEHSMSSQHESTKAQQFQTRSTRKQRSDLPAGALTTESLVELLLELGDDYC